MTLNNGVQGTRHKVPGPLTPDVGIKNIRMRLIPITLCLLTMVACSKQKQPSDDIEKHEWQRLKVVQLYWEGERASQLDGFSDALRQMSEPVYWNTSSNSLSGHFYRFLWLRTFDKPVIVTIRSTDEGKVEIKSKIFSGQSGFGIGQIEQEITTTNNSTAMATLMADLDRWLPYVPEFNGDIGPDGAMWMIDGIKDGKYYIVHRWSPESGWVRDIGLRFMGVANIQEKKIY